VRTIGKKILVGAIGFTVGPGIVLLTPYWIGFLFLGLFTTLVGYAFGILYIIYGGTFRQVRTVQKSWSSGGWLNRGGGGPVTVPGIYSQNVNARNKEEPDKND